MTDFKFAKECSEKGIEFKGCKFYLVKLGRYDNSEDFYWSPCILLGDYFYEFPIFRRVDPNEIIQYYKNPSEEELSKRLPNCLYEKEIDSYLDISICFHNEKFYLYYDTKEYAEGKTTKECYQKALLKLNDMELLK